MPEKNFETNKITFPEKSKFVIEKIVERYNFKKTQDEGIKKFLKARTLKERGEMLINLPGAKISRLIREYAKGKVSLEKFPSFLEKLLNISNKQAKEITQELKIKILAFIKPVKKGKILPSKISPTKTKLEITPSQEKHKKPPRKDTYREPIE